MIFADKLIRLRKKYGWSQEELADKMNVSRQAVSKWEATQNIPDLQKILQLSQLFGVTTDYLLKDEIEDEEFIEDENNNTSVRKVTLSEANEYIEHRKWASKMMAIATFLCIISIIPLFIFTAIRVFNVSEVVSVIIGITSLVLIIASAVTIFIYCGFRNKPYEFLDEIPFETEYGVKGIIKEKQKQYQNKYMIANIVGTFLCIISIIPLFFMGFVENEIIKVVLLCTMFFMVAVGVYLFVCVGVKWASMQRLLKEGEFNKKNKSKIKEAISTVYWIVAVAIFLTVSFIGNGWNKSWIIMVIAGVLYGGVSTVLNVIDIKK